MAYYGGVDCGTQGTKVVVYDPARKVFVSEGYAAHDIYNNERGASEQEPDWWLHALDTAMETALRPLSSDERKNIAGIGVSGQQHGLVVLGADKKPLCRAKLWNDTETADANRRFIEAAGGADAVIAAIGTALPVGYTASKLIFLRENAPEIFKQIAFALNPKDYINLYLTGVIATDAGSASGTGYFDVIKRGWSKKMASLIAPDFEKRLPPLTGDADITGKIRREIAGKYGLSENCVVAAGSGDNMMAAVGTGNVKSGIASMTLGTSGVLSVFTGEAPENFPKIAQIQNTIPDGWLPTICILNATSASTAIQTLFNLDIKSFDAAMETAPAGSGGVICCQFFSGERAPALESERGAFTGLSLQNLRRENFIRACAEAVAFGLRWGGELLRERGAAFNEIRLVGGGGNSAPWRQIVSDVFGVEVTGVKGKEAGAFGAALQAMCANGEGDIPSLCAAHIKLDEAKRALPDKARVSVYNDVYAKYLEARRKLYQV